MKFRAIYLMCCAAILVDIFLWFFVLKSGPEQPKIFFLDVGQGDSELIVLPSGIKILTDAGPDSRIVGEAEKILGPTVRYIDIAVISHPQADHFNGFNYLLDSFSFGAFIVNGRNDASGTAQWDSLASRLEGEGTPVITLGAGDRMEFAGGSLDFISPDNKFIQSGELNDTALVSVFRSENMSAAFLSDIGTNVGQYLAKNGVFQADIVKVAHHGSRNSLDEEFFREISPSIAIIEVGVGNRYHHPSPETISLFEKLRIPLFRTDINGTISVWRENGVFKIMTEKQR
jgi:beta-lactamase superfamily II metal-dependent hydrolase